ncbi:MAG: cytochrome P450 [Thermodesulfobacteriota bacterium]
MEDLAGKLEESLIGDMRDPYPMFAVLRREQPITLSRQWGKEMYTVFRHADCERVLRDAETFSSRIVADTMGPSMGRTILEMDGKEHQRHRGLISVAFRPQAIAAFCDSLVAPTIHRLVDDFADAGEADLVESVSHRLPILVIGAMVGIRVADTAQFMRWADDVIAVPIAPERGIAASRALQAYLLPVVAERRREPRDDLISRLVTAEIDGERLDDAEILGFLRLLLPAGAETTFRLLGNVLFALLSHPGQLDEVRADRTLLDAALDETLRWEAPLLFTARETTRETELCGTRLPPATAVTAAIGSANRDETVHDDPDRFDLHRAHKESLSFGLGRYFCLGYHLGRLEVKIAVGALLDRLPGLRLVPGTDAHVHGLAFRSPTALPVRFERAR